MSEIIDVPVAHDVAPQPPETSRTGLRVRLARGVGKAAIIGAIGLGGATLGSLTAVSEFPAPVSLGPGISAEASPIIADYSSITYGPTFGVPELHENIASVNVGVNLNIKSLDTTQYGGLGEVPGALFSDPKETIEPEVMDAIYWRAGEGGFAGAAAAELGLWGFLKWRQRRKSRLLTEETRREQIKASGNLSDEERASLPQSIIDKLDTEDNELSVLEMKKQKHDNRRTYRRLSATAASVGLLAGSGAAAHHEIQNLTPPHTSRHVVFSKDSSNPYIQGLLADAPELDGAFVTGDVGQWGVQGLQAVGSRIEQVNNFWDSRGKSFADKVLPEFLAKNGIDLHAPGTRLFIHTSDIHDGRPYLKHYLPQIIEALDPDFVINTGDEENYSGTVFLDNGAAERLADTLPANNGADGQPIVYVKAAGNHDEKDSAQAHKLTFKTPGGKTYHPIVSLDKTNNYFYTIDGIPIVGSPDLNRTTLGTKPASHEGQMENDAKQGELLAKRACEIYDETKKKPIVLAHEPQATYAAAASGCTSIDLSGHQHVTHSLKVFVNSKGSVTYLQNIGTASGDGPNDLAAIYNMPTTRADISFWLLNEVTGETREFLISVDPNGKEPTIKEMEPPASEDGIPATDDPDVSSFLGQYDPGALQYQQPQAGNSNNSPELASAPTGQPTGTSTSPVPPIDIAKGKDTTN